MEALRTEDVSLIHLTMDHTHGIAQLANDPGIAMFLRDIFPSPYTLEDAVALIHIVESRDPLENFGIGYKGKLAGVIGAHPHHDIHKHTAELGYWLGRPYMNRGIGTLAIGLMLHYCFDIVGYLRVQAITFENNPRSMRVLEKNAFKKEGIMRDYIIKNNNMYDAHLYALTEADYRNIKRSYFGDPIFT